MTKGEIAWWTIMKMYFRKGRNGLNWLGTQTNGVIQIKQLTTAENTSTSTFIRKPEAATAVSRAPDDGHCNARNMLSSVCTTKQ